MTALALVTFAACLGLVACGYLLGRRHAARIARNARGGYVTVTHREVVDDWTFTQAPEHSLFDQDAFPNIAMTDASLRTMAAALDATHHALDPHSRKVKP